jgi:hypothetical protein
MLGSPRNASAFERSGNSMIYPTLGPPVALDAGRLNAPDDVAPIMSCDVRRDCRDIVTEAGDVVYGQVEHEIGLHIPPMSVVSTAG